jgi:HAMP domain-containing protein
VDKLFSRLRIGEKIGLGFGLVSLLFIGVIWRYHHTLQSVLGDYEQLHAVFEARKSLAFEIGIELAAAREAEKDFLIRREERFATKVDARLQALRGKLDALAQVDRQSRQTAEAIRGLAIVYQERFQAIAEAWRIIGLDENSGLQGAFREKVHRLQELSANFNVDPLFTQLLQIRRSEKDLALRGGELVYRDRVRRLVVGLRELVDTSDLQEATKQALLAELAIYAETFEAYADRVLAGEDAGGGKGPFRDAAHRIEAILNSRYVPNLEATVLKLRRREKDYLLRGDEIYPQMVVEIARDIRGQIAASPIADADKALLVGLLDDYEPGFLALVEQNTRIATLEREMNEAANRVAPLIERNVDQANRLMAARVSDIAETSRESAHLSLIILGCALVLGIFFTLAITGRIVRPVRRMADVLDDLTYEHSSKRIPAVAGGRDEINAMAHSLNTLAEHRATFLAWWNASMREARALRDVHDAADDEARQEALSGLRAAVIAQVQQLNAIRGRLLRYAEQILEVAKRLRAAPHRGSVEAAETLDHAARALATLLDVVAEDAAPGSTSLGLPGPSGDAGGLEGGGKRSG